MEYTEAELARELSARHGEIAQAQISAGRVAIAGLGGLGSHIAVMLTRLGVGALFLVDFDKVELSNLNRQNYALRHVGLDKTQALAEQLAEINPYLQVSMQKTQVTAENAAVIFDGWPIVCEAFDRPEMKAMLVNTLLAELPDTQIVSGSGMAGHTSANSIKTTQAMHNLYLCGDLSHGLEQGYDLMSPRVSVCAAHQANMVLRLLLGITAV